MLTASRFWARVQRTEGCWLWQGAASDAGYGQVWNGERVIGAHRAAVLLSAREIPKGSHVHHVCGEPLCVRPSHLEVVEGRRHVRAHARKPRCVRGHDLTDEANIYVRPDGTRRCRLCASAYMREYYQRAKKARRLSPARETEG